MATTGKGKVKVLIKGVEPLKKNFKMAMQQIKERALAGMYKAAELVRIATETEPPVAPKLTGNLRKSWFVVSAEGVKKGGGASLGIQTSKGFIGGVFVSRDPKTNPDEAVFLARNQEMVVANAVAQSKSEENLNIIFGYGVPYAVIVHEMAEGADWSEKGSSPKWFETHLKNKTPLIIATVGQQVRLVLNKNYISPPGGYTKTITIW